MSTGIQWCDETWNPVVGCTRVSAGCDHCYAFQVHDQRFAYNKRLGKMLVGLDETLTHHIGDKNWEQITDEMDKPVDGWAAEARRRNRVGFGDQQLLPAQYDQPFSKVQLLPERLSAPLHWRKPRKVFVNSMSDLFHEDVPDEFIDQVFAVMALSPQHTYQVLTKRPERMRAYLGDAAFRAEMVGSHIEGIAGWDRYNDDYTGHRFPLPLPNVWLGTSVEDQAAADERIPQLLATPAAVRFLSCEPLLGSLDLRPYLPWMCAGCGQPPESAKWCAIDSGYWEGHYERAEDGPCGPFKPCPGYPDGHPISWVIVGGESGAHARACDVAWIRSIVAQCQAAGVPAFVKQLGSKPWAEGWEVHDGPDGGGVHPIQEPVKLKHRHGGDPAEWPEDLRVREFPPDLR